MTFSHKIESRFNGSEPMPSGHEARPSRPPSNRGAHAPSPPAAAHAIGSKEKAKMLSAGAPATICGGAYAPRACAVASLGEDLGRPYQGESGTVFRTPRRFAHEATAETPKGFGVRARQRRFPPSRPSFHRGLAFSVCRFKKMRLTLIQSVFPSILLIFHHSAEGVWSAR